MREFNGPERCNCWFWARWRFWRRGGYIVKRRSRYSSLIPHFLWSRDLRTFWSYSPIRPKRPPWDFFWFRGRVHEGDADEEAEAPDAALRALQARD